MEPSDRSTRGPYHTVIVIFYHVIFLVDEELRVLRDKIVQDYNELSISDLCTKRSGGYDIVFFDLDDKFHEMVSKITEIKNSQIFKKLWQKYSEKLKDEFVTMEVIFTNIWSRILDKLKSINEQFLDGEMQLKKVDKYLVMCKTDYDALEEEFMLLSRYFSGTAHLGEVKKKLGVSIKKVKSYKQLFDAQQAALAILELQEVMGLEGDFSQVEKIKEVRLCTFCLLYNCSPGCSFPKYLGYLNFKFV
jgi:hypothetical protein